VEVRFHRTERAGHARELATAIIATPPEPGSVRLVVSAGGDGTHNEVMSAAVAAGMVRGTADRRTWFFRFPLGTGNDGADTHSVPAACRVLSGGGRERTAGYLSVKRQDGEPLYGFNIASIGLDAYVALLTNRLKGSVPGDLYKLLADVMTLLYERIVGIGEMRLQWGDGAGADLTRRFVLCALGVSGHRDYGDHKPILPGDDNLCAIETRGVVGKIRLKGQVYRGEHVAERGVHMAQATRVTIEYGARIPLQIDGETRWLEPDDFPLVMEVHRDSIPVLGVE
jgi:diacylglycerol kinase family enzyme